MVMSAVVHNPPAAADGADIVAATLVVAASDSLDVTRADRQCIGVADEIIINQALIDVGGGKVILLEGNYVTAGNIVVPADTTFEGMGHGTIITADGAGLTLAISIVGDHVIVKDMKVILAAGAGTGGSRPNVLRAFNASRLLLLNLWLVGDTSEADDGSDSRQNGIYLVGTVVESSITNCRIETCERHAIAMSGGSVKNNIIANNVLADCLDYGIRISGCTYNTITGNAIRGMGQEGIHLDTSTDFNTIVSNTIESCVFFGIHLHSCSDNTISSNTCIGGQKGIGTSGANDANDNVISGNVCSGNSRDGIHVSTAPRTIIIGNTCSRNDPAGATYSGINIDNSDYCVISGNHCNANGLHGIYIRESSYCAVTGNVCTNQNTGDGIHVRGDAPNADFNTLTGNVCTLNASDGIEISEVGAGDANKTLVMGNQLLGNGGNPLTDGGTNTVFQTVAADSYNIVA